MSSLGTRRHLKQAVPRIGTRKPTRLRRSRPAWRYGVAICVILGACAVALALFPIRHTPTADAYKRIDRQVAALLAGIPQQGNTLGSPLAPITLQVFGDLECNDVKYWFNVLLPAIVKNFVRPNILRIEYRAMKTDTGNREVFIWQQASALATGRQDKMWNFLATFYREQGPEYTDYVTEHFLRGIARQVPDLNLAQWSKDRVVSLAKTVIADNHAARTLGFYDTPAFRIGRTGGSLKNFSGESVVIYRKYRYHYRRGANGGFVAVPEPAGYMHPLSLVQAQDIKTAIEKGV